MLHPHTHTLTRSRHESRQARSHQTKSKRHRVPIPSNRARVDTFLSTVWIERLDNGLGLILHIQPVLPRGFGVHAPRDERQIDGAEHKEYEEAIDLYPRTVKLGNAKGIIQAH